jgi:hypothetical protein
MTLITKEQFLIEHNKLSPAHLQASLAMLTKFQQEKKPLLKDDAWCIDKLRIPFIIWLTADRPEKTSLREKPQASKFRNYPETHLLS